MNHGLQNVDMRQSESDIGPSRRIGVGILTESKKTGKEKHNKQPKTFYTPAILRCSPEKQHFFSDLFSGILVGVVALPLAIAFAIASGAPPMAGIITGIIAGILISSFGGSRYQIGGPTGAFVGLCATIVAQHGLAGLALSTLMAGVLLVLFGLFRFGAVIKFIPSPVVTGFTTGIAVIIAATQLRDGLGISLWPTVAPVHFHERILAVISGIHTWSASSVILCVGTVIITILFRRFAPRWPGALIAIILAAIATVVFQLPVDTIGQRFGALDGSLGLPSLNVFAGLEIHNTGRFIRVLIDLSGPALAIALLAAIESLLSATVADNMGSDRHDPDSELIGQGIANLVVPWFGGIPATGAIARTATNIRSGAKTPLSGIIHALTLLVIALVAMPLVSLLPMAAMAGVLFVVAWYMSEIGHWPKIIRAGKSEAVLLLLTFGLTVAIDLTVAIEVGVVLGLFFFVQRLSAHSEIKSLRISPDDDLKDVHTADDRIEIFELDGPFFFGISSHLRDMSSGLSGLHEVLILRMRHVPFVDTTAAIALCDMILETRRCGCEVILSGVNSKCKNDLMRNNIFDILDESMLVTSLSAALVLAESLIREKNNLTSGSNDMKDNHKM